MPEMISELEVGSKRTMEYDESGSPEDISTSKMARSGDLESRLLLLSNACGGVIGKKGETITRLRNNYQVNIKIESSQTVDRTMTINGTLENCVGVIKEVLVHSPSVPYSTNQPCAMQCDLLIPSDCIGTIVGKAGARITEIRETTGAKIKIYSDCMPRSNERIVAVGGDNEDQVLTAVRVIYRLLMEIPGKAHVQYYIPENNTNKTNAAMSMPWTTGFEGQQQQQQQQQQHMNVNMNMLKGGYTTKNTSIAQPLMDAPVMVGGAGGGGTTEGGLPSFLQLQTVTNITAPSSVVGAIIGKGGSHIREIRHNSGCKISFSETEEKDASVERIITLTGTQQQVQTAEHMMAQHMLHVS